MRRLNPLGVTIHDTSTKPKLDAAAKRLLSHKPVIAFILKYCVSELRGFSQREIEQMIDQVHTDSVLAATGSSNDMITGEPQESTITGEGRLTFDVLTTVTLPDSEILGINIEFQGKSDEESVNEVRGMYYNARQLSMQLGRNKAAYVFRHPQKVYSIWLLMNASQRDAHAVTEIYPAMRDLGGHYEGHPKIDIESTILIRVPKDGEVEKARNPALPVTGMVSTLFSTTLDPKTKITILENEYGISCTEEMKEDLDGMFSYADMIAEEAYEKGAEKTRKEMLAINKREVEEARSEKSIDVAKKMLKKHICSDSEIADISGLTAAEVEKLKKELEL